MNYEGIEIDMLDLGKADSILVTRWNNGVPTTILIDGGNSSDDAKVLAFLKGRGVTYLDHIVCSHPHADHASGLIQIVESRNIDFGQAWIHLPWNHVDWTCVQRALNESKASAKRVSKIIDESVQITRDLVKAVSKAGKPLDEPFAGKRIGFLFVCGPSQLYYEELLRDFTDLAKLNSAEEALASYERQSLLEDLSESILGQQIEEGAGLGQAPVTPENNSSTILWMKYLEDTFLFTADAGVEALARAKASYTLSNLCWMQIPHHGSRRNINEELIGYFRPKAAYVSANGSRKHPRLAVVNAFKKAGAGVFSTHYPHPGHLRFSAGSIPKWLTYSSATPLYEA